jgi:hypothetical protein
LDWHIGWKKTMATQFFILKNTKERIWAYSW